MTTKITFNAKVAREETNRICAERRKMAVPIIIELIRESVIEGEDSCVVDPRKYSLNTDQLGKELRELGYFFERAPTGYLYIVSW